MVTAQWSWKDINGVGEIYVQQGGSYHADMPHDGNWCPFGPPPDTGDLRTSKVLEITLRLVGDVHNLIAECTLEHGQRLQQCALNYRWVEGNVTDLVLKAAVGGANGDAPPNTELPEGNPFNDVLGFQQDHTAEYRFMPTFPAPPAQPATVPLGAIQASFVGGDIGSLVQLAEALNRYATGAAAETFNTLLYSVKRLIESDNDPDGGYHTGGSTGRWIGPAAYAFRNAWLPSAAMMNGLNITLCTIAGIVGSLAQELASLEMALENKVTTFLAAPVIATKFSTPPSLSWFQPASAETYSGMFLAPSGIETVIGLSSQGAQNATNASPPVLGLVLKSINQAYYFSCRSQADEARARAAARLAGQAEILLDAVNYYQQNQGVVGTGSVQIDTATFGSAGGADASSMQTDLQAYLKGMNSSRSDLNAVQQDLSAMGAMAKGGASVAGDVNDIKKMEETASVLEKGKSYLSLVGDALPMLAMIGVALA